MARKVKVIATRRDGTKPSPGVGVDPGYANIVDDLIDAISHGFLVGGSRFTQNISHILSITPVTGGGHFGHVTNRLLNGHDALIPWVGQPGEQVTCSLKLPTEDDGSLVGGRGHAQANGRAGARSDQVWGANPQVSMKSDEDNSLAGLWHTEVGGVEQHGVDAVFPPAREIALDLLHYAHLGHAWDVLHDECPGLELPDQLHKLAIKAVLRVVDQAGMIPDLRKALARWATDHDIHVPGPIDQFPPEP
jgi:hypothetical protein